MIILILDKGYRFLNYDPAIQRYLFNPLHLSLLSNIKNNCILIIYQRILQNMSHHLLPLDNQQALQNLPSLNRINNTLLFIETVKNIPNHSLNCLDVPQMNEHFNEQDSLGVEIKNKQRNQIASNVTLRIQTPDSKKKKTGCTCKKTKCLKMYCQCFAIGKQCTSECACYSCCNTEEHLDLITKAKLSIKSKTSRKSNQGGCTCKKTQCRKKYCECYNAGIACTQACKCNDCENHADHSSCSLHSNLGNQQKQFRNRRGEEKFNHGQLNDNGIIEAINSENWQQEDDLSVAKAQEKERKLELTAQKQKECEQSCVNNVSNLRSYNSIDLANYFN